MSWLLFLDESGHDHKSMPYEVRGGIALHVSSLWAFVQGMQRLELDSFGCHLHQYRCELKGNTLSRNFVHRRGGCAPGKVGQPPPAGCPHHFW